MSFNLIEPPIEYLKLPPTNPVYTNPVILTILLAFIVSVPLTIIIVKKKWYLLTLLVLVTSSLIVPAINVKADIDFGSPLSTANIGLFVYYNETSFTLQNTTTAFVNYTDHSTYYDGYVRVWQDASGDTYVGDDVYVDVLVRVRADGYIMAWLDTSVHLEIDLVYHAKDRHFDEVDTAIPVNYTTCHRAIERVYYVANMTYPEAENLYVFDYNHNEASILSIVSMSTGDLNDNSVNMYFIIPSSTITTIHEGLICYGGENDQSLTPEIKWYFDEVEFYHDTSGNEIGWLEEDPTLSLDTQHRVRIWGDFVDCGAEATLVLWLS